MKVVGGKMAKTAFDKIKSGLDDAKPISMGRET